MIKNTDYSKWRDKYPYSYYFNHFLSLNSSALLLELKMFPNCKEITESMAMVEAVFKLSIADRSSSNISLVCVGDGHKPRTAALFATLTKWNCFSIDPALNKIDFPIKRLDCFKTKIEDIEPKYFGNTVIIVHCHSHAKLTDSTRVIQGNNRYVVSMPCCVQDNLERFEWVSIFKDDCVMSKKNVIYSYML